MRILPFIAVALVALVAPRLQAEERNSASVSYLDGDANDGGRKLALNDAVYENDTIETGAGAKLELKMHDGSVVRLGPSSKLLLKSAYFGPSGQKKFSAKLLFGRVWSKVSGLVGSDSKFEVETDNAVAGVRGTTFRVDAHTDKSVLVRVYAGAVAMNRPGVMRPQHQSGEQPQGGRHRKNAPKEISKAEWERLVGRMMEMSIAADGSPGEPKPFTAEADAKDDWAAWNTALDAKQ